MEKPRYQDFLNDLASGRYYGVFIDDTGSPGLRSTSSTLHPKRKSWVGVVVPPSQMPEVLSRLIGAVDNLQQQIGSGEYHFAEIYGGKGDFKDVDLQLRLSIFRSFVNFFTEYRFPVFVQTLDPRSLNDIRPLVPANRVGPFNLEQHEDMALFFLLIRIKWYIEENRESCNTARVFVDEGYKRNNIAVSIPPWKSVFADGLISFARSSSILPLQLADFAAFALNRTQLLIGKNKLKSLDKTLLEILSPMAWNYQNIKKRVIRSEELEA